MSHKIFSKNNQVTIVFSRQKFWGFLLIFDTLTAVQCCILSLSASVMLINYAYRFGIFVFYKLYILFPDYLIHKGLEFHAVSILSQAVGPPWSLCSSEAQLYCCTVATMQSSHLATPWQPDQWIFLSKTQPGSTLLIRQTPGINATINQKRKNTDKQK